MDQERKTRVLTHSYRLLWAVGVILHFGLVLAWWWLMPKGFPISHPRFWVNSVLPWAGTGILSLAIRALVQPDWKGRDASLVMIPAFWAGAIIASAIIYPQSFQKVVVLCLLPLLTSGVLALLSLRINWKAVISGGLSALVAVCITWSQRAPLPSTNPLDQPPALLTGFQMSPVKSSFLSTSDFSFDVNRGLIRCVYNDMVVEINPLLTFGSRSPDRFWTSLSPERDRIGPARKVVSMSEDPVHWVAQYESDFTSHLVVNHAENLSLSLESVTSLPSPIYSHLNSYCRLWFRWSKQLSIRFSPCPEDIIEIVPFQYPFGRPIRFAYLSSEGFHVVEATSGEKGPFQNLASGELMPGQPLALEFLSHHEIVFQLELTDWSREASLDISPTAGWGMPMNAIQFFRTGSESYISISLAATSVGRGWDSVGHSAGHYRNRIRIGLGQEKHKREAEE